MGILELKRNRENFELNLFEKKGSGHSYYRNIIDKDYKKLAIILDDLERFGVPIRKAIKLYLGSRDWLGLD